MIFNNKVELKLGLRYFNGGYSSGQSAGVSTSSSTGSGSSTSSAAPQYTPTQLLEMYSRALPALASTANTVTANSPAGPALAAANKGAVEGVNAIDMTGLSPGEYNATERSLNQSNQATGNTGVNNGTNTVRNAMDFGGAFNNKVSLLNNATNTATNAANAGSSALNTTNSMFAPFAANASAPISKSSSMYTSASNSNGLNSSANDNTSGGISSCYLTTACCEFKGLPDDCKELTTLRHFRDRYVPKQLVKDYYRLSETIVPKIKNNSVILNTIFETVCQCVRDIAVGRDSLALKRYVGMVEELKAL